MTYNTFFYWFYAIMTLLTLVFLIFYIIAVRWYENGGDKEAREENARE